MGVGIVAGLVWCCLLGVDGSFGMWMLEDAYTRTVGPEGLGHRSVGIDPDASISKGGIFTSHQISHVRFISLDYRNINTGSLFIEFSGKYLCWIYALLLRNTQHYHCTPKSDYFSFNHH